MPYSQIHESHRQLYSSTALHNQYDVNKVCTPCKYSPKHCNITRAAQFNLQLQNRILDCQQHNGHS